MSLRIKYYITIIILSIIFIFSVFYIKYDFENKKIEYNSEDGTQIEPKGYDKYSRFLYPTLILLTFFISCYFVSKIITLGEDKGQDKFLGIWFMIIVGIILLISNGQIFNPSQITKYVKGKKFSFIGAIMTLGVSAIVFGFLDNFGMKLGVDAMDNTFVAMFLGQFARHKKFENYHKNIMKNISTINDWVSSDWRKIMNHTLRFKDELAKNPKLKDLNNAINSFNGVPLDIPSKILSSRSLTNEYVDNIRQKFDIIDGSKSMLGNTFSDIIGSTIAAGVISLFVYLTCYDGLNIDYANEKFTENNQTGEMESDGGQPKKWSDWLVDKLHYYAPIMQGLFIGLGCMIPVYMNIAMTRMGPNYVNLKSWIKVIGLILLIFIMMFLSVNSIKPMTLEDKRNSIRKTIENVIDRVDLSDNSLRSKKMYDKLMNLINELKKDY